jgi:hypothetical protein
MKYLVTYHGGGMPTDPAAAERARQAFVQWATGLGVALVDPGAPLANSRTVTGGGVADGQAASAVSGYSIIEAGSLDEAVDLVRSHPFVGRGGALQVSELAQIA